MVSSGSAQGMSDTLAQARQMLFLGKLPAAIRLAQLCAASPETAPQAQLLLVRCLMLQGRYWQAEATCDTALESTPVDSEAGREMRLRRAFLSIYTNGDPAPAIAEGRSALEWARSRADVPRLSAQTQVLLGKALALASEWGLLPANAVDQARNLLAEAAQGYREEGSQDEALSALLSLGQLYAMGLNADPGKARTVYQQAFEQSQAVGNGVRAADAALRLAELDFDTWRENNGGTAHGFDPSSYQGALELYGQAGYALGAADVELSLGGRMSDSGFDGAGALQKAEALYRQEDNPTGIYSAQRALSTWYVRRGDLAEARDYHQQSAGVAREMGFPLGQATACLGLADYYFRSGDYARALAFCEQAETMAGQPAVSAIVGLSLANIYTSMHLPERAESACRRAIAAFAPAGPGGRLSLARFILGNVLSGKGDWAGAIAAWREGLAEDEIRRDAAAQAEKLQCIAQATVMQYYQPRGPAVPAAACEEAMSLYARSISALAGRGDPQASAIVANTYQLKGQTALTCGRPAEAIGYLEQAANVYGSLEMGMQAAVSHTLVGLLCYEMGNRGSTDLYAEAVPHYEQALRYFESVQMRDMAWKVRFHLALVSFHRGRLALTGDQQQAFWRYAAACLEDANSDIEFVRGGFVAADQLAAQDARLGLVSDKEKVYVIAVRLHYRYLHDKQNALGWLERLKGRAFLDALALTSLRPPAQAEEALLHRENGLLEALHAAASQAEVVALNEQLHALWDQMAADSGAAEYVALRRGRTADWNDITALLRSEEGNYA